MKKRKSKKSEHAILGEYIAQAGRLWIANGNGTLERYVQDKSGRMRRFTIKEKSQ